MILTNKDINTMIKIENLIGMNERKLFGRNKDKRCTVNWYDGTTTTIDFDDFVDFMNLIERALQDKQKASEKSNAYNKSHAEKHREYNREWRRKNYKRRKGAK